MKKSGKVLIISFIATLVACNISNKPEAAAEEFCKALYTADFDGAKALCTEDSKQAIDFVAAFSDDKEADMKKTTIKFETIEIKMAKDGNSADIQALIIGTIAFEDSEKKDTTDTKLHMVKQNDKWLVDFKLK